MYKEHYVFESPKDENAKIWRYMDFTKFLSLLDKSALFFTRVDKLGDPFEGTCPEKVINFWEKKLGIEYPKGFYEHLSKFTAVNCWHLNEYESAAMWKMYLKSNEGIAVQSTFKRLKDSLIDKEHDILIGKVKYINYGKLVEPTKVFTNPVIYKRKIFRHEQELRAVIKKLPKRGFSPRSKKTIEDGIYVLVDVDILIDKIYLAPISPVWQFELLKSVMGKYQLDKDVIQSSMDEKPLLK